MLLTKSNHRSHYSAALRRHHLLVIIFHFLLEILDSNFLYTSDTHCIFDSRDVPIVNLQSMYNYKLYPKQPHSNRILVYLLILVVQLAFHSIIYIFSVALQCAIILCMIIISKSLQRGRRRVGRREKGRGHQLFAKKTLFPFISKLPSKDPTPSRANATGLAPEH